MKKIPVYVRDLMQRSAYCFDYQLGHPDCAPGYTIKIRKASPYSRIETFRSELERLQKWVSRQPGGECIIVSFPSATHYVDQFARVTIWDPIMKNIEMYISANN